MDTSDADWGGWNLDSQGEIDAMIDAYEQEPDTQRDNGLMNTSDIKIESESDSNKTLPMEYDVEGDYEAYEEDDFNSFDENSMLGSEDDEDSDGSIEEELVKITKTNGTSNGSTEKHGMAKCEKCGTLGVRHAFYSKSKRFCSLTCSRSSASLQKDSKSHVSAMLKSSSADNILNQNKELKSIPTAKKNKQLGNKAKQQIKSTPLSQNAISKCSSRKTQGHMMSKSQSSPMSDIVLNANKSFDWSNYLKQTNCQASPVSCFKHCPMSDGWDNITVGMKVEVQNIDCDLDGVYWIATVVKIAGYIALMRYEGFSSDASHDFWLNLCTQEVHPVGWCATIGKPLVPPKTIQNKYADWKDFLVKRLTGARTLPNNFYNKVVESMTVYSLHSGMKVEVVDKMCVSAMRVASVDEIIGGRLRLQYVDSMDENDDFWCHMQSALVHYVGWAQTVGHKLHASADYKRNSQNVVTNGMYADNESTPSMFPQVDVTPPDSTMRFKEGMKLEAIDPLSLASICVATVRKVLRNNYLMIGIDGSIAANGSDWFCYHATSPCIFPVGFCEINGLELTPPRGYKGQFNWFDYLKQTKSIAAPVKLFDKEIPKHGFKVGMKLEAVDLMEPRLICVGTVTKVVGRLLRIHFDGWDQAYDQWIDCRSPDIYPVGWCEMVGYHLEGPHSNQSFSPIAPPITNKKRKTKNQMYRGPRRKKRKSRTHGVNKPGSKLDRGVKIGSNGTSSHSAFSLVSRVSALPDLSAESSNSQSPLSVETSASSSTGVKMEKITDSGSSQAADMPTLSPPIPALIPVLQTSSKSRSLSQQIAATSTTVSAAAVETSSFSQNPDSTAGATAVAMSTTATTPFGHLTRGTSSPAPQSAVCSVSSVSVTTTTTDSALKTALFSAVTTSKPDLAIRTVSSPQPHISMVKNVLVNQSAQVANGTKQDVSALSQALTSPVTSLYSITRPTAPPAVASPVFSLSDTAVSSSAVITRHIPRLVPGDSGGRLCDSKSDVLINPEFWTTAEVCQFLTVNDYGAYCESFSKKNIDGQCFLNLTKEQIVNLTGMKVGLSLKIYDLIQQLKQRVANQRKDS